jgi:hypothetical protein
MEERDHRNRPVPFRIQFVKKNGEVVEIENCVLAKSINSRKSSSNSAAKSTSSAPKQANEWDNATRNLYQLDSQQIREVYIWAITGFNNQPVVY